MGIDYQERIPNNVDLSDNRRLQRALEAWQPGFQAWWQEMGPDEFRTRRSTCAPRSASNATAGPISAMC